MRTFFIISIYCLAQTIGFGQSNAINQLDDEGQKDGKWHVYYDSTGEEITDSTQAIYYRYTFFVHGKDLQSFDWHSKNERIIFNSAVAQKGGLKILNGTYKIVDKDEVLQRIHVFKQGEYVSYKSFYPTGELKEYCNFENQHFERGEFEPNTYCKRRYDKNEGVKYYYMRKPQNGDPWSFYRSSFDSTAITNQSIIGDSTFVVQTHFAGKQPIREMGVILIDGQRPLLHGDFKRWYPNGQLKMEEQYDHDKLVGDSKSWNKDGTVLQLQLDYEKLNKTDEDGEKTGWWITYLDENLVVLNDSIGATHCMYNYYTGKFFHYKYGKGFGTKKFPVHLSENDNVKLGNFTLLNGDYTTKYKDGNIRNVLSASNGVLIEFKSFYPDGQLHLHIIYSKECGTPLRHCLKEYDTDGSLKYDGANMIPQDLKKNR